MIDTGGVGLSPVIMPSGLEGEDGEEDKDARSNTSPKSPTRDLESDSEDGSEVEPVPVPLESKSRKKAPAWVDPDDLDVQVSLAANKRLRKLCDTALKMKLAAVTTNDVFVDNSKSSIQLPNGLRMPGRNGPPSNEDPSLPLLPHQKKTWTSSHRQEAS